METLVALFCSLLVIFSLVILIIQSFKLLQLMRTFKKERLRRETAEREKKEQELEETLSVLSQRFTSTLPTSHGSPHERQRAIEAYEKQSTPLRTSAPAKLATYPVMTGRTEVSRYNTSNVPRNDYDRDERYVDNSTILVASIQDSGHHHHSHHHSHDNSPSYDSSPSYDNSPSYDSSTSSDSGSYDSGSSDSGGGGCD